VKTPAVAPSNPLDVTTSFAAPDRKLPDNRCLGGGTTGGRD
jgi:malate/lactate dehydrogenase